MAYFTVDRSVYPWMRSSSNSSSTVSRFLAISRWSTIPFRITMLGRPQRIARNRTLFMVSTDKIIVTDSSVRMGTIPVSRGMP